MKNLPVLQFSNPTFRDGFNITVRLGDKWHYVRKAELRIAENFSRVINLETKLVKFSDLTKNDLIFEHDPSCRTPNGLAKVMKSLYPEFTKDSMVTVVTFFLSAHKPRVGDDVYRPDMMGPIWYGNIKEVIELNDGFWEVQYMYEDAEGEKWFSFIAHEQCDWYSDMYKGNGGWYDYRGTYSNTTN